MNVVATFPTPAAFFDAVRGPAQHNAHVECWRGHRWITERRAASARGVAAVMDFVEQDRETQAQRVAADYGYNTGNIRYALDRWQSGCFSAGHGLIREARIRQLTRALDIAIEWHGAMAQAAE